MKRLMREDEERRRKMRDENDKLLEAAYCVVCKDNMRNIVLLPCSHFCICNSCEKQQTVCPMSDCRIKILNVVYTYPIASEVYNVPN